MRWNVEGRGRSLRLIEGLGNLGIGEFRPQLNRKTKAFNGVKIEGLGDWEI